MRKFFCYLMSIVLLCSFTTSVFASSADASTETILWSSTTQLDNGLTVITQISELSTARSTDKTAEQRQSIYDGDSLVAVLAFQATFRYDGNTVNVVSKTVTQTDTYGGWSFTQESFTSSQGTVTLQGKLKFLLLFNTTPVSMSLTCDKNGNLSY